MSFKIDLSNIKQNSSINTNKISINDFTITSQNPHELTIMKDKDVSPEGGEGTEYPGASAPCAPRVIAEYKNNSWFFNGKSINAMWDTLQNHFDAIQKIITELNKC